MEDPRSLVPLKLSPEIKEQLQFFGLEQEEVKEVVLGTSGLRATYIFAGFDKILVSEQVPASAVMLHKRTRRLTLIVNPKFVKTALLAKVSKRKHRQDKSKARSEDFMRLNTELNGSGALLAERNDVLADIVKHEFSHVWFHHLERDTKYSEFMMELVHGALLTLHMKIDLNLTTFFQSNSSALFRAAIMFPSWVLNVVSTRYPKSDELYTVVTTEYSENLDNATYIAQRCFQALRTRSTLQPKVLARKFCRYAQSVQKYEEGIDKLIERLLEMFQDMDEQEEQHTFFSPPPKKQEGDGQGEGDGESDGSDAQAGSEDAEPEAGDDAGEQGASTEDQDGDGSEGDDQPGGDGSGGDGSEDPDAQGGVSGSGVPDVPDDGGDDDEGSDAPSDGDPDDAEPGDDGDPDGSDEQPEAGDEEGEDQSGEESEDSKEEGDKDSDQEGDGEEDSEKEPAQEDPEYEVPEKEPQELGEGPPKQIDPKKEELDLDGETYLPLKNGSIPPDFDEQVASILKAAGASGHFVDSMIGDIDEAKLDKETIKAVLKVSHKSLIQYARQKLDLTLKPSPVSTTIVPNRHPIYSDMVLNNSLSLGRPPRYRPIRAREDAIRRKKVRLYIDVSGSMTNAWEDIVAFSIGLNKHCDLEVFQFSTDIQELTIAELKKGVIKTWGGTDVTPIVNDIIEASKVCDAFTIMGDRMYGGLNHVPRVAKPITILDIAYNTRQTEAHFRPTEKCTVHFVNLNDDFSLIEEGIVER